MASTALCVLMLVGVKLVFTSQCDPGESGVGQVLTAENCVLSAPVTRTSTMSNGSTPKFESVKFLFALELLTNWRGNSQPGGETSSVGAVTVTPDVLVRGSPSSCRTSTSDSGPPALYRASSSSTGTPAFSTRSKLMDAPKPPPPMKSPFTYTEWPSSPSSLSAIVISL